MHWPAAAIAAGAGAMPVVAAAGAGAVFMNSLIMKFVYLIFYAGFCYVIVDKCCDVIDILPSNVMRWVNMHGSHGNNEMEGHAKEIIAVIRNDTRTMMTKPKQEPKPGKGGDSTTKDTKD